VVSGHSRCRDGTACWTLKGSQGAEKGGFAAAFCRHQPRALALVPIGESGITRYDEHVRKAGQIGGQILSNPVREYRWSGSLLRLANGSTTIESRDAATVAEIDVPDRVRSSGAPDALSGDRA
jgi:hypothetical protein